MSGNLSKNVIIFLIDEVGLDESSIELGLKLSIKILHYQFYYGVMEC